MGIDKLSDAFNVLKTNDIVKKGACKIQYSQLIGNILQVLKDKNYISDFKMVEDGKGNYFAVTLAGKINICSSIKPRLPVKSEDWIDVETKYLPAVGIGYVLVSTPKGVMTNEEAKTHKIGGRLLGYIY